MRGPWLAPLLLVSVARATPSSDFAQQAATLGFTVRSLLRACRGEHGGGARRSVAKEGVRELVWFGYSGGGSLAVLLAARVPEPIAVVTVAANLNVDAWTDLHRDQRLTGSINPARQPRLPRLYRPDPLGGRSRSPGTDRRRAAWGQGHGSPVVEPAFDHVSCWADMWPRIVTDVEWATRESRRDPPR